MSKRTDTERLDWLTKSCDMGRIVLDPDLEGTPRIRWSVWDQPETTPRDAIDVAMQVHERQETAMRNLYPSPNHPQLVSDLRDPERVVPCIGQGRGWLGDSRQSRISVLPNPIKDRDACD